MIKKEKGITLIALVVTIVVLLILAAVSISMLTGENGIISKALEAKEKIEEATKEEEEILDEINNMGNINIEDLNIGWTLGNSLDCDTEKSGLTIEEYETAWNNPKTTKEMIKKIKEQGFNTIMIPVTWFNHLDSENNIDKEWLIRVKEIVDYAMELDMYVILNTHHDDKRLNLEKNEEEFQITIDKYKKIWEQIANTFKDYEYNLIFETLNEPRVVINGEDIWHPTNELVYKNLNNLSNELLKSIRSTGGKNTERYVIIPTYGTLITSEALDNLELPTDKNIAISVHGYIIYEYCSDPTVIFNDDIKESIRYQIQLVSKFSKNNNVPVIITELGCVEKNDREEWIKNIFSNAAMRNIPLIWWDDGQKYKIFDRNELKITDENAMDTIKEYYFNVKAIDDANNLIENINYTQNVEYNEGNMGIREQQGKNIYYVNMPLSSGVRFKFLDQYELNAKNIYQFSCKIKTKMTNLKIRYVLNFYDKDDNLIYSEQYSDMTKKLVDGTKEEYEFTKMILVEDASKVQLERIAISPFDGLESQDVEFELYDIALKGN